MSNSDTQHRRAFGAALRTQQENVLLHAEDHAADGAAHGAVLAHGDGIVWNANRRKGIFHASKRQRHVPLGQVDFAVSRLGGEEVLAAREARRADAARMADHLVHRRDLAGPAVFHHADAAAVAVTLIAVVADPEDGAVERREQVGKLDLKIPL